MQPKATFHFPKTFQWGATYPNFLTPDHIVNNNWENWLNYSSNDHLTTINSWPEWKDDFERAKMLNLNSMVLTVDWAKVQPSIDKWDQTVIDHYRSMVKTLTEKKIQPFIILQHFCEPLWFFEKGGWENEHSVYEYLAYVEKIVAALREFCNNWITFYEPNLFIFNAYLSNNYPPGSSSLQAAGKVYQHIIRAHKLAYESIHQIQIESNVSVSPNIRDCSPAREKNMMDRLMIPIHQSLYNRLIPIGLRSNKNNAFLSYQMKRSLIKMTDFTLFSFYGDQEIKFSIKQTNQIEDTNTSQGLITALKWAGTFQKPVYIIGTNRDQRSNNFFLSYLHKIWKSANLNPYIKGYFYHSFVDGFEWEKNFDPNFGLFETNPKNQTRSKRNMVDLYKNIMLTNSISFEIVNQYCPELTHSLFP